MSNRPVALVTGPTSGIGEQLARKLAAKGHDLVLVARGKEGLDRVAGDLRKEHGTESEILPADLADEAQLRVVEERIRKGPEIQTVVNNAGFGFYGVFSELDLKGQADQVKVNALAMLVLSHAALATMVPRGSGNLLNVASLGGFATSPLSATYSATKGFALMFTEALHQEVKASGVHVTVVCPGFTPTNFQDRAGLHRLNLPRVAWTSPEFVAAEALKALDRNQAVCVPGIGNKLVPMVTRLAPRPLVRRVAEQVMKRL